MAMGRGHDLSSERRFVVMGQTLYELKAPFKVCLRSLIEVNHQRDISKQEIPPTGEAVRNATLPF